MHRLFDRAIVRRQRRPSDSVSRKRVSADARRRGLSGMCRLVRAPARGFVRDGVDWCAPVSIRHFVGFWRLRIFCLPHTTTELRLAVRTPHTHTETRSSQVLQFRPPVFPASFFSVGAAALLGSLAAPTAASSGHASGVTLAAAVAEGPDTPPPPFAGTRLGCPVPGDTGQPTMRVAAGSESTTSASGPTLDRAWSLNGLSRQRVSWRILDWGNMAA